MLGRFDHYTPLANIVAIQAGKKSFLDSRIERSDEILDCGKRRRDAGEENTRIWLTQIDSSVINN